MQTIEIDGENGKRAHVRNTDRWRAAFVEVGDKTGPRMVLQPGEAREIEIPAGRRIRIVAADCVTLELS